MAIRIIEGIPGSGKSYFAVHHILTKYFDYNKALNEWTRKPEFKSLVIVTNIDSFPFSVSLESLIEKAGSLEAFFNYDYQEKLSDGVPYIYLIDEAQGIFPFTYRDTRVFLFFQKHRHLGMDIYLMTQDADVMAKGLRTLAEFHIVAARRSLSLAGELRYRFVDPQSRECWQTKVLKKDWKIFSFYKSFSAEETEKSSSVPRRFMILTAISITIILVVGYFGIVRRLSHRDPLTAEAAAAETKPKLLGSNKAPVTKGVSNAQARSASDPFPSVALPRGVFARVVGLYRLDDKDGFLVALNGQQIVLDADEMISLCKCHYEQVRLNSAYQVDENLAPNSIKAALLQGAAVPQAPARPWGNM